MNLPRKVTITDVGPRDGLQNERGLIPTGEKIRLIDELSRVGVPSIEFSSFVSPKWVPQMADAAQVAAGIKRNPETEYVALVLNLKRN
jgi:hydroxymethylglutaryl-CoA lyase